MSKLLVDQITQSQNKLEEDIKRRRFESSHEVAEAVTRHIAMLVKQGKYGAPAELLKFVSDLGSTLRSADKMNFVVPNTIKRILHVIREAQTHLKFENQTNDVEGLVDLGVVKRHERAAADDSSLFFQNQMQHFEMTKGQMLRKSTAYPATRSSSLNSFTLG